MHRLSAKIAFASLTSELVSEQSRFLALSALDQGKDVKKQRRVEEGMWRDAEVDSSREDHRNRRGKHQMPAPCSRARIMARLLSAMLNIPP